MSIVFDPSLMMYFRLRGGGGRGGGAFSKKAAKIKKIKENNKN
jgi:hypothetical protein